MTSGSNGTSRDHATGQDGLVGQLVRRAKLQPAKAAVTGALVLVLVVLVVRMCVGPKSAGAAPVVAVAAPAPANTSPAAGTPGAGATASAAIRPAAELGASLPFWRSMQAPAATPRVLTRDMFTIDLRQYAKASDSHEESSAPPEPPPKPAEPLAEILKRQASGFRLQGTVTGPVSAAFLDGTCVHEGDECRGFRITAITEQSVMLECEGVRLELRMPER